MPPFALIILLGVIISAILYVVLERHNQKPTPSQSAASEDSQAIIASQSQELIAVESGDLPGLPPTIVDQVNQGFPVT